MRTPKFIKLARFGLASLKSVIGAFVSNTDKLIEYAVKMAAQHCTYAVFGECSISGYPAQDLVGWEGFIVPQLEQLKRFAEVTKDYDTVFVLGLNVLYESQVYNVAAVVHRGSVIGLVPKEKLPNYDVFDEYRTLALGIPGFLDAVERMKFGDMVFRTSAGTFAVVICEDAWSLEGPVARRAYSGAETIISINGSPFRSGTWNTRRELVSTVAANNYVTVVYVNKAGGKDALSFDGGGFVNQCGRMLCESKIKDGFTVCDVDLSRTSRIRRLNATRRGDEAEFKRKGEKCAVVTLDGPMIVNHESFRYPVPDSKNFFIPADPQARKEYFVELIEAKVTGLDGYMAGTGAFEGILIALSGGKDSVLTLLDAHHYATKVRGLSGEALKKFILCVSMPTKHNSQTTRDISRDICAELGVGFIEIPIGEDVERMQALGRSLLPPGAELDRLTKQNTHPRVRAGIMWMLSNQFKMLWLQTGNMSEAAVGYTTIGGDNQGGLSLIGNLPKTVIIGMLNHMKDTMFLRSDALERLMVTKASAELEDNQEDEKDLMPFPLLDACLYLFAGERMMPADVLFVLEQMFEEYSEEQLKAWVIKFVKLFRAAIYKWVQRPIAIHLGSLDLDYLRALRFPVVTSLEWLELEKL